MPGNRTRSDRPERQGGTHPTPLLIDTIRLYETPEAVELELKVAGPAPRALALVLDAAVRLAVLLALLPLASLAGLGTGLLLLALFALEWLYPVLFEVRSGATPGKKALGLRVIHDDGTPVGWPASLIRNLLRVVDFLPIFYGVGLISTLVDRDFRRLGDLAAGTLVVYADLVGPARSPLAGGPAWDPPPDLSVPARQAVLAFAERCDRLSEARRIELAEILAESEGLRGIDAVARVQGWALGLSDGRRALDPSAGTRT